MAEAVDVVEPLTEQVERLGPDVVVVAARLGAQHLRRSGVAAKIIDLVTDPVHADHSLPDVAYVQPTHLEAVEVWMRRWGRTGTVIIDDLTSLIWQAGRRAVEEWRRSLENRPAPLSVYWRGSTTHLVP